MTRAPFLEHRERLEVRRTYALGRPFLHYRDGDGVLCIHPLEVGGRTIVGRSINADVALRWDFQVSGHHAILERVADEWVIVDNDSRNGTFLQQRRIGDRRRLQDGDEVALGKTVLVFHDPGQVTFGTEPASPFNDDVHLSAGQRRVLAALCEPSLLAGELAAPPSNRDVARRANLGVETVRTYLRILYVRFEVGGIDGARKRLRLVQVAVQAGLVDLGDLDR